MEELKFAEWKPDAASEGISPASINAAARQWIWISGEGLVAAQPEAPAEPAVKPLNPALWRF